MQDFAIYIQQVLNSYFLLIIGKIPAFVATLLFLWLGLAIIKHLQKFIDGRLKHLPLDPSLHGIVKKSIIWTLKILLFISIAGLLGVQTTSFITALGATGVAIGLALQGSLSNIAGSFLILFFRPFRVGDYIKAQGQEGTVQEISFFTTQLETLDHRNIYIPNGPLANGSIENLTENPIRRVEISVGIGYQENIAKSRNVLLQMPLLKKFQQADAPEPRVVVLKLAESSIDLSLQFWVATPNYWDAFYAVNEAVKETLEKENIEIPFPQRVVQIKNSSTP